MNKESPACSRKKREAGAVLVFAVLAVFALFSLAMLALNHYFAQVIRSEVRALAEAAAHGGASQLCPAAECWQAARAAALSTINNHTLTLGLGAKTGFSLSADGSSNVWNVGQVQLSVDRGRWSPDFGFESLDAQTQSDLPGMPFHIAANAVQVSVAVQAAVFWDFYQIGTYTLQHTATATARRVHSVCAAPFALPICALVNQEGALDQANLCTGDRLYAGITQYTSPEYVPGFDYAVDDDPAYCYNPAGGPLLPPESRIYFQDRVYSDVSDHFGVVGLPSATEATEEAVRGVIEAGSGCTPMALGQTFTILEGGLIDPVTDPVVWSRIIGSGGADAYHVPYTDTDYPAILATGTDAPSVSPPISVAELLRLLQYAYRRDFLNDARCNSHRFYRTPQATLYSGVCPMPAMIDGMCDLSVWQVKVPVIADVRPEAAECNSDPGPVVGADGDWQIIGFVDVNIFDNDIGIAPPVFDETECQELAYTFTQRFISYTVPCNVVRSRILCNTDFVAAAVNRGGNTPTLVSPSGS